MAIQMGRPLGFVMSPRMTGASNIIWFGNSTGVNHLDIFYSASPDPLRNFKTDSHQVSGVFNGWNTVFPQADNRVVVDLNGGSHVDANSIKKRTGRTLLADAGLGGREISKESVIDTIEAVLHKIKSNDLDQASRESYAVEIAHLLVKLEPSEQLSPIFSFIKDFSDLKSVTFRGLWCPRPEWSEDTSFPFLLSVLKNLVPRLDLRDGEDVLHLVEAVEEDNSMNLATGLSYVAPHLKDPEAREKYTLRVMHLLVEERADNFTSEWFDLALPLLGPQACWEISEELCGYQKHKETIAVDHGICKPFPYYTYHHAKIAEHLDAGRQMKLAMAILDGVQSLYSDWHSRDLDQVTSHIETYFGIFRKLLPLFGLEDLRRLREQLEQYKTSNRDAELARDIVTGSDGDKLIYEVHKPVVTLGDLYENAQDRVVDSMFKASVHSVGSFLNQNVHLSDIIENKVGLSNDVHRQAVINAMMWCSVESMQLLSEINLKEEKLDTFSDLLFSQIDQEYIKPLKTEGLLEARLSGADITRAYKKLLESGWPRSMSPHMLKRYLEFKTWVLVAEELLAFSARLSKNTLASLSERLDYMQDVFDEIQVKLPLNERSQFEYVKLQINKAQNRPS